MKKMAVLSVLVLFAVGCASQTVYVKTLGEPKWEVEGMSSIGIVPITVQKTSTLARHTLDLAIILTQRLTESAYYTAVKQKEYREGAFETGPAKERFLTVPELQNLAKALAVEGILTVEALSADVWISHGEVPYSVGFGGGSEHVFGYSAFSGRPFWYARARLVVSFDLRRASDGQRVNQEIQTHEFARDFDELVPSEEKIISTLLERVCDTFIPNIDVHFLLSPRTFLFDGSKLVSDGVAYAMRQDEVDFNAALQLWQDALKENPNSVAALYNSAVVLELRQQYSEAYEKYLQAEAASRTPNPFRREIAECKRSASVFADFISKKEEVKVQPQPPQEEKKPEPQEEAPKESPQPPQEEKKPEPSQEAPKESPQPPQEK
jgi:hypothetical protein